MNQETQGPAARARRPGRDYRNDGARIGYKYTAPLTTCKHCGQPSRRRTCSTCAAWIKVHAAHLDMAAALRGVRHG